MVVRTVSQKEILQDIRSGMDDGAICKKYNLSVKGLRNLYDKLIAAGLLGKDLEPTPRRLNLLAILGDIHAGLSRSELMKKYELSEKMLLQVSKKLLDARGKRSAVDNPETVVIDPAEFLETCELVRHEVDFDLPVYEANRPEIHGMVRDVSEEGVSVAGIDANVGDIKTLVVLGDELTQFFSFEFVGYCRWAFTDATDGTRLAGFTIEKISRNDAQELRNLVRLITTGG